MEHVGVCRRCDLFFDEEDLDEKGLCPLCQGMHLVLIKSKQKDDEEIN